MQSLTLSFSKLSGSGYLAPGSECLTTFQKTPSASPSVRNSFRVPTLRCRPSDTQTTCFLSVGSHLLYKCFLDEPICPEPCREDPTTAGPAGLQEGGGGRPRRPGAAALPSQSRLGLSPSSSRAASPSVRPRPQGEGEGPPPRAQAPAPGARRPSAEGQPPNSMVRARAVGPRDPQQPIEARHRRPTRRRRPEARPASLGRSPPAARPRSSAPSSVLPPSSRRRGSEAKVPPAAVAPHSSLHRPSPGRLSPPQQSLSSF